MTDYSFFDSHLGGSYPALLQFILNHRRFMRSRVDRQRQESALHWFTLLGLGEPQPLRS